MLLLQLEIPVATATAAARAAHSAGVTVILNASPSGGDEAELAQLAEVTDVLVVNETEAAQWVWPVPHRVTTLGARGASYSGDGAEFTVPAPAVDPLDTSGAGDVFAGVLAAGWSGDRDRALRRACAAGALATLVSGAGDCAPYAERDRRRDARGPDDQIAVRCRRHRAAIARDIRCARIRLAHLAATTAHWLVRISRGQRTVRKRLSLRTPDYSVEEPYLLAKHGAPYRDFTARVGPFVPGVGLIDYGNAAPRSAISAW